MSRHWLLAGGLVMLLSVSPTKQPKELPVDLPTEVSGWVWDGKEEIYNPKTLFRYIDGMAEVYLAYNFRLLVVRRYTKTNQPSLTLDFFDMGSASDAYGVFTFERDGETVGIGQDADYAYGMLRFWKGRYFVTVTAEKETSETRKAVLDLGKGVAAAIREEGQRPQVLQLLPEKNLIPHKVLFFRHPTILNRHFFLADKDILNLSPKAEGVLGVYETTKGKVRLIIVRYPTERDARKAEATFGKFFLREGRAKGIVLTEDKKWTAARRWGQVCAFLFDALTQKEALEVLKEVKKRVDETTKGHRTKNSAKV
ncbi:MAG: hypothetical protein NZ959_03720 [Armatimonadetes bacterium]|nr:hypothetical protein [Armatimonadota bacterium]MDW8121750.1 DUF6599 family protein [Armatimonadota bacterium]